MIAGAGARSGIVVLQFDDGADSHFRYAYPILQRHRLKGSFGVVTGFLGRRSYMSRDQVKELHRSGHEIHDHTFDHDAAFWGEPSHAARWPDAIQKSLNVLAELGIKTRGWNQPGGPGQGWSPQLRDALALYYDYAAARVGIGADRNCNFHWNLRDDPFSLGMAIPGWGWPGYPTNVAEKLRLVKSKLADAMAQNLVAVVLFHRIDPATAEALDALCQFIKTHRLVNLRTADAVHRVTHSRRFIDEYAEQIPNAGFRIDLDQNGRPDGWNNCAATPPAATPSSRVRAARLAEGASTTIYGPENGRNLFRFQCRVRDAAWPVRLKVEATLGLLEQDPTGWDLCYRFASLAPLTCELTPEWRAFAMPFEVPSNCDRMEIRFTGITGEVELAGPSFRRVRRVFARGNRGQANAGGVGGARLGAPGGKGAELNRAPHPAIINGP
jgi:peptidoglycan/xylan/chitin deacetylase (PgdA/CDA1 family)